MFRAIHEGAPDQELLSYQYLQMLPQLAQGEANKIFVIPSEFSTALANLGGALGGLGSNQQGPPKPRPKPARHEQDEIDAKAAADAKEAAQAARDAAEEAEGAVPGAPPPRHLGPGNDASPHGG